MALNGPVTSELQYWKNSVGIYEEYQAADGVHQAADDER